MKLQKWFKVRAQLPLRKISLLVLCFWCGFVVFGINYERSEIESRLSDIEKQIALSINQKNRPFLELALESSFKQMKANAVALCENDLVSLDINADSKFCTRNSIGMFSKQIAGAEGAKFVIEVGLFESLMKYSLVFIFFIGLLLLVLRILNRLRADVYNDIVLPLNQILDQQSNFQIDELNVISKILREAVENEKRLALAEVKVLLSKQVAHDIRSPLSALTMVTATLSDLAEEKRLLIRNSVQRINDIANDLIQKGSASVATPKLSLTDVSSLEVEATVSNLSDEIEFIPSLIDLILSEKRMQFRDHSGLSIDLDLKDSFGAFAKVNRSELKRVVSNLVNNAVEALANKKGLVIVAVRKYETEVEVSIRDNGKGIPKDVLEKVGVLGFSYGKSKSKATSSMDSQKGKNHLEGGSGLGIYHARNVIKGLGGDLKIESVVDFGTTVIISIPLCEPPVWFAGKIDLSNRQTLVSVDDDVTIHQIWSGRLSSLQNKIVGHVRFQSGEAFLKFVGADEKAKDSALFLIDYEFLNQPMTGLDLIEELGIAENSILVTSRYEERSILDRVEKLGIKMLPKSLAGFVPIFVPKVSVMYDAVLVDDDSLIHAVWAMESANKSKLIKAFCSGLELMSEIESMDRSVVFYIDSNLANGESGPDLAKKLFEMGFSNLYLSTGYDPEEFKNLSWIKGVVGKDFPLK